MLYNYLFYLRRLRLRLLRFPFLGRLAFLDFFAVLRLFLGERLFLETFFITFSADLDIDL